MDKSSIILFSQGEVTNWPGLPKDLLIEELIQLFGEPAKTSEETLGYYPALRYDFAAGNEGGDLTAYTREQNVVLIETKKLPGSDILNGLPEPDTILPHQILVDKAYAAEYVFCERGLNLTVAKHFDKSTPDKIVRCRGFEKINKIEEFDTRYYRSFENMISW